MDKIDIFQAGKFDLIPTVINVVAACTSVGLVRSMTHAHTHTQVCGHIYTIYYITNPISRWLQATVVCDIILLNFLKGAKQYKAKKFEEVTSFYS